MTGTTRTNIKAYPLAWPVGRARTEHRGSSKFAKRTTTEAFRELKQELQRLGASLVVVSTNIPLKGNGEPYSDPGRMPDPGVAVYFQLDGKPYCLSCDRCLNVEENLYALAKHIDTMRGQSRWGVASVEETFAGFRQLGAGADAWETLGLAPGSAVGEVEAAWRALAKARHPDAPGGSHEAMAALNAAKEAALAELAVRG